MREKKEQIIKRYLLRVLPPLVVGLIGSLFLPENWRWLNTPGAILLLLGFTTGVCSLLPKTPRGWKVTWWAHALLGFCGASFFLLKGVLEAKAWPIWLGVLPGLIPTGVSVFLGVLVVGLQSKRKAPTNRLGVTTATSEPTALPEGAGKVEVQETMQAFLRLFGGTDGNGTTVEVHELLRQLSEVSQTRKTEADARLVEAATKLLSANPEAVNEEERQKIIRRLLQRIDEEAFAGEEQPPEQPSGRQPKPLPRPRHITLERRRGGGR